MKSDSRIDARSAGGGPAVFLRRLGWGLVSALAMLLLQSLFHQPVGEVTMGLAVALLVLTAFAPFNGLLVVASLGPVSSVLFILTRTSSIGVQFAETLILAFIAGWAGRRALVPTPLAVNSGTRWASMLLLVTAAASGVAHSPAIRAERLGEPLTDLIKTFVTRDYLLHLAGSMPLTAAALVCECMLLLIISADSVAGDDRKRDTLLAGMVVGAAAAGSLNVLRIVNVALAQHGGWEAFLLYLRTLRVNVQYADLNAAGSYFALMLPISVGLLAERRALAILSSPIIGAALWISGSRFGLAGACVGLTAGALAALRGRRRLTVLVLTGVVLLGISAGVIWKYYPRHRNADIETAARLRLAFADTGLRMAQGHPVFGVGLGQYQKLSSLYAGPALTRISYPAENAHNYFIQILAELGVPGLLLFVSTLLLSLRTLYRRRVPWSWPSAGLSAGLVAFLATCLGGHPLLVPESSYPFWICLGLAAAPLQAVPGHTSRLLRDGSILVLIAVVVTLPYRIAEAFRDADMANVTIGMSQWQHEPDGSRFRWASGRSVFYVRPQAHAVRIPLRNGNVGGMLEVRVFLNGREADRVRLAPDQQWRVLRLILPRRDSEFSRVDVVAGPLETGVPSDAPVTDRSGVIQIGQPVIEE